MAYADSVPLKTWLGSRRDAITTLAAAHAAIGEVDGRGRPLEVGRPVGRAYVIHVVAEFQAFVRDLYAWRRSGWSIWRDPIRSTRRC